MTKLRAYETALTLYGLIFLELSGKTERYFFGTIKRDFVFFLFALIWNADHHSASVSKCRLIPKNFNEWSFGKKKIYASANIDPSLSNIDRDYFRQHTTDRKRTTGIAVLGSGIDFEKTFDLETLAREREIRAVVKKSIGQDIKSLPFFLKNLATMFSIYRVLKKVCALHCSLPAFLRYFAYYAFASARFRTLIKGIAKNNLIGKIMSSDLDNVVGNSFILWGHFYGLSQIAYPHGSPVFLNKNRYFEPEEYYIWTTYQRTYVKETKNRETRLTSFPPKWLQEASARQCGQIKKITIVTAMEENLEVPFTDKVKLIDYIGKICEFCLGKNIAVSIKSHKLLDWHEEYDKLCVSYKNLTHVKNRWNIEEVKETDIGILMNTSTTLGLQLLYCGIPVITCAEVMPEIVPKHFSAPYLGIIVNNQKELFRDLGRLLEDKESYKKAQSYAIETFRSIVATIGI